MERAMVRGREVLGGGDGVTVRGRKRESVW